MTTSFLNSFSKFIKSRFIKSFLFILSIIVIWQIGAALYHNPIILPTPLEVFAALENLFNSGEFLKETIVTLGRGLLGVTIALLIGLVVGVSMGINQKIDGTVNPIIALLQSTPAISWLLLALIWFDNKAVPLFIIIISSVPTIIINVSEGIKRTDKKLLEMARLFKVKKAKIIEDIYIPSVFGYIVSSLRIVISLTYKTAVMAEVLAHPGSGIGERMNWARVNVETAEIIAWTLIIVIFAIITDQLLLYITERRTEVIYDTNT